MMIAKLYTSDAFEMRGCLGWSASGATQRGLVVLFGDTWGWRGWPQHAWSGEFCSQRTMETGEGS
jgi:hypothetical protein